MDHLQGARRIARALALATLITSMPAPVPAFAQQTSIGTGVTITATVPGTPPGNGGNNGGGNSGGGGGGGGGRAVPEGRATVVFTGRAYPGSTVTILEAGRQRGTTVAGTDAMFSFRLERLQPGTHTFSLYSTDRRGTRSAAQTYPLSVTANLITTVSGIFIAPTIGVSRPSVSQGEPITVLGQTAPGGDVSITVNSETQLSFGTKADAAGLYAYTFLTDPLENGWHEAQSRTSVNGTVSGLSTRVSFQVGTGGDTGAACRIADLNCDGRVNLIDFSIAAFWFRKPSPAASVDLSGDGIVNLVDFSIIAFHWTG